MADDGTGGSSHPLRAGTFAGAVALSVLWVASGVLDGVPFAPAALAQWAIRSTPGDVATFFIETLGHWAMRLMTLGVLAASCLAAGMALSLSVRRSLPVSVPAAVLGIAAMIAASASPGSTKSLLLIALVSGLGAATYLLVARGLLRAKTPDADEGRRRVLRLGVTGAGVLALSGTVVGWLLRKLAGPDTDVVIAAPARPATIPERPDFPTIDGLSPEITSVDEHYVVDINIFKPSVEADTWTLRVHGLVDRPLTLTFEELQERFEIVEAYSVLTCISNKVGGPLVGNSAWGGVRLADVLEAAGLQDTAADVVFRSAEGYSDSIAIDFARDSDVLLALTQNGEPLTQEHGFPCRVRVPPIYGMKNVKWLTEIELVGSDHSGYWQERGWSDEAVVHTQSRIDVAGDDFSATAGVATWIAGVAWAGARGISKVEVSTDGGHNWDEAQMREPVADDAWRQWAHRWTPAVAGTVRVAVRATDGDGETQTARLAPPHPSGATGYHIVEVAVSEPG